MLKRIIKNMPKSVIYLLICQGIILLIAMGNYVFNRGKAFSETWQMDANVATEKVVTLPTLELGKGIYQVVVSYSATEDGNTLQATCGDLNMLEFVAPTYSLESTEHQATMIMTVSEDSQDVNVAVHYAGKGDMTVSSIGVYETSTLYKKNIFLAVMLCALLAFGYKFAVSDQKTKQVIFLLTGIFVVSCYPLWVDYLPVGHDIPFHLLRIEGIKEGLAQGIFPVKIHPVWAKDYGYAVGVFYADLFLYFPAFLRLIGFSVQEAYKWYAASINLGTVLLSYFSFKAMFHNSRKVGVIGSLAYTLAAYRLLDMYTRASVGEYTAMMFFPVVLLGFYLIFAETTKTNWLKHAVIVALGLTGVIQSHVLSCEMLLVFILLGCILLVKRVFKKFTFCALACGAGITVLLNVGFLIPFLDMYQSDLYINMEGWIGSSIGSIQTGGMFPLQLFGLFQNAFGGSALINVGVSSEMTANIGIFLLFGAVLFLYLISCHKEKCQEDKHYKPAIVCFAFGALALWMSTCYFPWDAIARCNDLLDKLVVSLEFPWRFMAMATLFLTFVVCFSFSKLEKVVKEQEYVVIVVAAVVLLAVNSGWFFYNYSYQGTPYRVYEGYELDSMTMYSYDYLPAETTPAKIKRSLVLGEGIQSIEQYDKKGTTITTFVAVGEQGGYIEFPLNYYKYYECKDVTYLQEFDVESGYNGMVRVYLPEDYAGVLQLKFQPPWFWKAAELLSLLTLIMAGVMCARWTIKQR